MLIVGHSRTAHPGTWAWPAGLIVWGPGNHTSSHAHHSIQVVMALSGRLKTRGSSAERWGSAGAVIVPPDVTHEIDARGRTILIAFIDPESALGRAMTARAARAMTRVADSDVQRWRRLLGPSSSIREAALRKWLEQELGSGTEPGVMDPRVATVIRVLRERTVDLEGTSLGSLASLAGLSPSRFTHLFAASVGIPLRRYLLWLRVQRAGAALSSVQTVTEAAYIAGFSDAAHLTRTFRRMLGIVPSEILRHRARALEVRLDDPPHS